MTFEWLSEERFPLLAGSYGFTYVHGLTPEQLIARLGGRVEHFVPMTANELEDQALRRFDDGGLFFGVAAVGAWTLIVETLAEIAPSEEILLPLSAGTRLVSQYYLDVKGLDSFYWIEDGEIRFAFYAQEGYSEEVPDELAQIMRRIESDHRHAYPHEGPGFVLAEHLTGIRLTPQMVEGATYLCGSVPQPPRTSH
ncbi:DUF6461 domain-containing protein [Nonomuraea sp. SYSU D8015]|uniref:DUF6461 domain-containing protein n=1 Tax=Nonomuraea sp. SYSU D8015 TaxID=2593644 RepID=UPI0016605A44|nr:DUF6461 domain-containing protein [Nonomuraea sp. SYSU D8015]